jgi:Gpi18-like mannosyltransferase
MMQRVEQGERVPGGVEQESPDAPQQARRPFEEAFRYCLRVFLGVRVGLAILVLAVVAVIPMNEPVSVPGWPAPSAGRGLANLAVPWERFDALWFLRIATSGYEADDGSAVFFPLYPLTVRAVSAMLGDHPLAAALIVSHVSFLAALIVLYLLVEREHSREIARQTVLYLALFPAAFFFFAPYAESLFLFLTVASVSSARRGRWWLAGVAGALAAATRSIGLVLVLALGAEAIRQVRETQSSRRMRRAMQAAAASLLPAVGTFSYLGFWQFESGNWLAPLTSQGGWQREFSPIWATLFDGTVEAFRWIGSYPGGYHLLDWLVVVPLLAVAVWLSLRSPAIYSVYALASLLIPLSFIFPGRPFMSVPRFALTIFPLFWAIARLADRFRVHQFVVASSAVGLGIFTLLFVNWYWIF